MKIIIAGEGGVGKTTLVETFRSGQFFEEATVTVPLKIHTIQGKIPNNAPNLQIWDLGGQRRFFDMGVFDRLSQGAHAALICFDTTDLDTLEEIPRWLEILPSEIPRILVGTKANTIEEEEIGDLKAIVAPYLETFNLNEFMISDIGDKTGLKNIFRTLIRLVKEDGSIIKFAEPTEVSDEIL